MAASSGNRLPSGRHGLEIQAWLIERGATLGIGTLHRFFSLGDHAEKDRERGRRKTFLTSRGNAGIGSTANSICTRHAWYSSTSHCQLTWPAAAD